ncbi:hypothetical protein ACPPVT_21755 [Angustibacter sp. McL0619]|uniref:hypothetical protein n=1 Tax=Angustibacter sp. McL0619 TaxID=3415676 RepID=UPI003CF25867
MGKGRPPLGADRAGAPKVVRIRWRTAFVGLIAFATAFIWLPAMTGAIATPGFSADLTLAVPDPTQGALDTPLDVGATWNCVGIGREAQAAAAATDVGDITFSAHRVVGGVDSVNASSVATSVPAGQSTTWRYTATSTGEDTVGARVDVLGGDCFNPPTDTGAMANPFQYEWLQPAALVLTPDALSSEIEQQFTVTATYDPGEVGPAVDDAAVVFHVAGSAGMQPLTLDSPPQTFAENGVATFTYSRSQPGTDTITASIAPAGGQGAVESGTITHNWRLPPLALTLTPGQATSTVGDSAAEMASVTRNGVKVNGVPVTFRVAGAPNGTLNETRTTASGEATLQWSRLLPGSDRITARAVYLGQTLTASATRVWVARPRTSHLTLTLGPPGVSTTVDDAFTATAVVELDGAPVNGAAVSFSASQAGSPNRTGTSGTGSTGAADFSYSRPTPGDETVTATAIVSGQTVTASMPHRWVEGAGSGETPTPVTPSPGVLIPPGPATPSPTSSPAGRIAAVATPPGGTTTLAGTSCPAGSQVTLEVGGQKVGETKAAPDGTFKAVVQTPDLPVGRYVVTATCGGQVAAQGDVDLVGLTSTTGTAAAASVTSAAILTFVVLLLALLLRMPGWRLGWAGRSRSDPPQ